MCYQPSSMATEANPATKQKAYKTYDVTTHWLADNVTVGESPSREELQKFSPPRTRDAIRDTRDPFPHFRTS